MTRKKSGTGIGLSSPKSKINLSLSLEAKNKLDSLVKETGLTRTALFEKMLNDALPLSSKGERENIEQLTPENTSQEEVNKYRDSLAEKLQENSLLSQDLEAKKAEIEQLKTQILHLEEHRISWEEKEQELQNLYQQLKETKANLTDREEQMTIELNKLKEANTNQNQKLDELNQKLVELQKTVSEYDELGKSEGLKEKDSLIKALQAKINSQTEIISQLKAENHQAHLNYESNQRSLQTHLNSINHHQQTIINDLQSRINLLESVASIGEKTLNKWRGKIYS